MLATFYKVKSCSSRKLCFNETVAFSARGIMGFYLPKHHAFLLSVIVAVSGCASQSSGVGANGVSSFMDGNGGPREISGRGADVPELLNELAAGNRISVDTILSGDADGSDAALARSERGRIAQLQGDSQKSVAEFNVSVAKIKEVEDRAKISASDVGSHTAALLINDNMIPYELSGFERVLVYHFQALNYLMQGKVEDAGVEVRRANAEQGRALKDHEEELAEAEKEASSKGFKPSDFASNFQNEFADSKAVAALVKNSFQNAYTFYMSGVVHEILKEPNDAYIDYKKALEIAPDNKVIQRDVARLAKSLSMTDDIGRFSKRFPAAFASAKNFDKSQSEVIVLFEDGVVPGKTSISFPIPIPIPSAPGLTSVAIPMFKASVSPVYPVSLRVGGKDLGSSERICAIDALAVKAFEEQAPAMITRQVVRAAIKGAASSVASKEGGAWVGLAVSVFNVLTEHADVRSWRSLPQNAQVLRAQVAPGATIELVHEGSGARESLALPKGAGKRVVIRATRIGRRLLVQHVVV